MGVSPVVTFQIQPFSTEPGLWEKGELGQLWGISYFFHCKLGNWEVMH